MTNPAAILTCIETGRFHPIMFREAPMPGNIVMGRYKSMGHHTLGFEKESEAIDYITSYGYYDSGKRWLMNEGDMPVMVQFFNGRK